MRAGSEKKNLEVLLSNDLLTEIKKKEKNGLWMDDVPILG